MQSGSTHREKGMFATQAVKVFEEKQDEILSSITGDYHYLKADELPF